MAFVPGPNVAEAELIMSLDNQIIENTLYFQASASLTISLMGDLAAALASWWAANIATNVSDQLALNAVAVTDLTTNTSPATVQPISPPTVGTVTSPALPNNVVMAVTFKTNFRGRSSRGRNFIAGLCENQVTANSINPVFASNIIAAYEDLIGAGTFVTGLQWGVFSRFTNNAPRITGLFRPITSVNVFDLTVDSMRRRLPGRGN